MGSADSKRLVTLWSASEAAEGIETLLAPGEKTAVTVVSKKDEGGDNGGPTHGIRQRGEDARASNGKTKPGCENGISPDGTLVAGIDDEGVVSFLGGSDRTKTVQNEAPECGSPGARTYRMRVGPGRPELSCLPRQRPMLRCEIQNRKATIVDEEVLPIREDPVFSWSSDGRRLALISHKYVPRNRWTPGCPESSKGQPVPYLVLQDSCITAR